MILERKEWIEYHENGAVWIQGEIAIIAPMFADLYRHLLGWEGYKGQPVCRVGLWTCYHDNGQINWRLEYNDDGSTTNKVYPSYNKDGNKKTDSLDIPEPYLLMTPIY